MARAWGNSGLRVLFKTLQKRGELLSLRDFRSAAWNAVHSWPLGRDGTQGAEGLKGAGGRAFG